MRLDLVQSYYRSGEKDRACKLIDVTVKHLSMFDRFQKTISFLELAQLFIFADCSIDSCIEDIKSDVRANMIRIEMIKRRLKESRDLGWISNLPIDIQRYIQLWFM